MNNKPEKIIMYDSPEAAKLVTVTGWTNSDTGFFYVNDESVARWSGCTHVWCKGCGRQTPKSWSYCKECREMRNNFRYRNFEKVAWDGASPVCEFDSDQYFFGGIDEVEEYCDEFDVDIKDIQLVYCKPIPLPEIDILDHLSDVMADDQNELDIPKEIIEAAEVLNCLLRKAEPMMWEPTNKAVIINKEKP